MAALQNVGPVGPSIGWLFAKLGSTTEDARQYVDAVRKTGADAIEFTIMEPEEERRLAILALPDSSLRNFSFRSLHLGSFKGFPPPDHEFPVEWMNLLDEYKRLCAKHHFDSAPAHPDTLPPHVLIFSMFLRIPVAIENMDPKKTTGKTPNDLACYASMIATRPRWVLDVQHAYEVALQLQIPAERLVRGFCAFMGDDMTHLHVSGEIREGEMQKVQHAQLHVATNRDVIFELVRIALEHASRSLPIILEGEPLLDVSCGGVRLSDDVRQAHLQRAIDDMHRDRDCFFKGLRG